MARQGSYIAPVALMIGILSSIIGCAVFPSPPGPQPDHRTSSDHRVPGVPFYPQEDLQCGPASLASLLNFWGGDADPGEIARRIYSKKLGGSLPLDMEIYAAKFGSARFRRVVVTRDDPEVLKREIGAGRPVILFLDLGFWVWRKGHFVVGVGYDDADQVVIAHSGRERESMIPYAALYRQWSRTHYWSLYIVPEDGHGD